MHPPSPLTALSMLTAFREKKITLTQEYYDELFDTVLAELEAVNNETYRLAANPEELSK